MPVNVHVPTDLAQTLAAQRRAAHALREDLGGVDNATRAQTWGTIGRSHTAPDFFDGSMNPADQKAFAAVAGDPHKGPIEALQALAEQGAQEVGVGVLSRNDKLSFLGGHVRSYAVVAGTAKKGADGAKIAGHGAKLSVQVEYESTRSETKKILDVVGGSAHPDVDGKGHPKNFKARLNLEADIRKTGLHNIHFAAQVDGVPAVDALALIKDIGDEKVDFPAALPLKVLLQKGNALNVQIDRKKGASIALRTNLEVLKDLDIGDDKIPNALLSASLDGAVKDFDGKDFLDVGSLKVSLDSKLNILWDNKGKVTLEVQDATGKYVPYDTQAAFGTDLDKDTVLMLLGMAGSALNP